MMRRTRNVWVGFCLQRGMVLRREKAQEKVFLEPRRIPCLVFLIVAFFSISCARWMPKARPQASSEIVDFSAQIVDPHCLLKGNLVIEPFKPGEGVFADAQVSQASLTMVKGFVDTMSQGSSDLNVITDDQTEKALFFIKGYVIKFENPLGLMDRVKKARNTFAVEGKVINLETNRVLVLFSSVARSSQEKNINDCAYATGKRLADYLLSQSKEQP